MSEEKESEKKDNLPDEEKQEPLKEIPEANEANKGNDSDGPFLIEHEPPPPLLTPKISPVRAAFIGLLSGFFVYQILSSFLTIAIFGMDFENADPNALRLMQSAGQILFMLLPALLLSKIIYDNVTELLRVRLPDWRGFGLFVLAMFLLIIALQNFLLLQGHYVELFFQSFPQLNWLKEALDSLNKMVEGSYKIIFHIDGFVDQLIIVLVVAIIPAIAEEVMFRGYIQRSFELRFKPFIAASITAFFFSIYHLNPAGLIGLFIIGLFLGYSTYKTDSILVPIGLHFLNNFVSVLFIFFYGEAELTQPAGLLEPEMYSVALKNTFYMGALFLASLFAIHYYYKKHAKAVVV